MTNLFGCVGDEDLTSGLMEKLFDHFFLVAVGDSGGVLAKGDDDGDGDTIGWLCKGSVDGIVEGERGETGSNTDTHGSDAVAWVWTWIGCV